MSNRIAPLTPGSVDTINSNPGQSPFDAWEFSDLRRAPANPTVNLKGPWSLGVRGQRLGVMDHQSNRDEAIPTGCELFELNTPDLVSSLERPPNADASFVHFPARLSLDGVPTYDSLWSKWAKYGTIGVFKATTNLVMAPEDLTTANWANVGACATVLSDYSFQGRRFTKITNSAAWGGRSQDLTVTAGARAVQCTMRVDTVDSHLRYLVIYEGAGITTKGELDVDFNAGTVTPASGAVLVSAKWYGTKIVEIMFTSAAIAAGTARVAALSSTNGDITYYTAIQVENSTCPMPYTPTSRAAGGIKYACSWTQAGAVEFWMRQWFSYDTTETRVVLQIATSGPTLQFFYLPADDKFHGSISDGTNYVGRKSATAYNNGGTAGLNKLWDWIHVKFAWDAAAKTFQLWVNGTEEATADSSGVLGTWAPPSVLYIGVNAESTAQTADSQITDLDIWPTADTSTTHFALGRPYFDAARWLGENSAWRMP